MEKKTADIEDEEIQDEFISLLANAMEEIKEKMLEESSESGLTEEEIDEEIKKGAHDFVLCIFIRFCILEGLDRNEIIELFADFKKVPVYYPHGSNKRKIKAQAVQHRIEVLDEFLNMKPELKVMLDKTNKSRMNLKFNT